MKGQYHLGAMKVGKRNTHDAKYCWAIIEVVVMMTCLVPSSAHGT